MGQELARLLQAAGDAVRTGQTGVAQRHWERVLTIAPDHPIALNGLGMLAMAGGRSGAAAVFFLRAAAPDPGAAVLWLNHARAARASGDDAGERASLLRAVAIDPLSLLVHVRLAENAERNGESREASERWRAVTAMAQNMAEIPADARPAVEHGREFVAAQTEDVVDRIK